MNHSKPGQKLSPELKAVTDQIWSHNRGRYGRLVLWIWQQQKRGYPDEAVIDCLTLSLQNDYIHKAGDWWKYLTQMIEHPNGKPKPVEPMESWKNLLDGFAKFEKKERAASKPVAKPDRQRGFEF